MRLRFAMTDDAVPTPQQTTYDASRVMLNGAAIALVSSLVNGMEARQREESRAVETRLLAELRAVEERQTAELDKVVRVFAPDIQGLEVWRKGLDDARLRRDGQLSVLQNVGAFLLRYDKVILAMVGGALIGVAAALFGHPA